MPLRGCSIGNCACLSFESFPWKKPLKPKQTEPTAPVTDNAVNMESTWKIAIRPSQSRNPQQNSSPKPKKQPKTSPSSADPTRGGGLLFTSKFHCKNGSRQGGKSQLKKHKKTKQKKKSPKTGHLSGTYIEERDAPMPGVPWRTGLFVIANSPR